MKKLKFLLIPLVFVVNFWLITQAFELISAPSDFDVFLGLLLIFVIITLFILTFNYVKKSN